MASRYAKESKGKVAWKVIICSRKYKYKSYLIFIIYDNNNMMMGTKVKSI